jgi:hypothetical protein
MITIQDLVKSSPTEAFIGGSDVFAGGTSPAGPNSVTSKGEEIPLYGVNRQALYIRSPILWPMYAQPATVVAHCMANHRQARFRQITFGKNNIVV